MNRRFFLRLTSTTLSLFPLRTFFSKNIGESPITFDSRLVSDENCFVVTDTDDKLIIDWEDDQLI